MLLSHFVVAFKLCDLSTVLRRALSGSVVFFCL